MKSGGASINLIGIFSLVAFSLSGLFLLCFACFHHQNFWSFLVFVPAVAAFFVPAICFGYQKEEFVTLNEDLMDRQSFRNCRELGWSVSALLLLVTYLVPILAWYNTSFPYTGVIKVEIAITCWVWAFIIWLRIFVFYSH